MFLKINLLLKYSGVQLFLWQICVHFSKFLKMNLMYFWCLFGSFISPLVPHLCVMSFFIFKVEGSLFFCLLSRGCSGETSHLFTHRWHGLSLPLLLAFVCSWHPSRNVKWDFPAWGHCVLENPNPLYTEFPSPFAAELRTRGPWLLKQSSNIICGICCSDGAYQNCLYMILVIREPLFPSRASGEQWRCQVMAA